MTLTDIRRLWAQPISNAKQQIPANHSDYHEYTVLIHTASWCPDCEREVSQLLALDEQASHGFEKISLHSYEDKESYQRLKGEGGLDISCLPTLIFCHRGEEVLRIEEDSAGQLAARLQQM